MLIRVAVATRDRIFAQSITNRLISFSMRKPDEAGEIEFDFAYFKDLSKLVEEAKNIDMSFISYEVLENSRDILLALYRSNPGAFSIPCGSPDEKICDFLALRPAGHLRGCDDQDHIDRLCEWCAEGMTDSADVIQIKTRQGCYAVTASSVLFCQSDQKYVMIVTETGRIYRKLEKLDTLMRKLPDYFVRVHQSYLINSRRIIGLDKSSWELVLDSGDRIPVSRVYKKAVSEQVEKFLSGRKK